MCNHHNTNYSRRDFLTKTSLGLGALSLSSLMGASKLLDINGDEILDLYLLKGSNEFNLGSVYKDEILLIIDFGFF